MKSVEIRSFFLVRILRIRTEYGEIREKYGVSVRIQSECGKIRTTKNSVSGHFSRDATLHNKQHQAKIWFEIITISGIKRSCLPQNQNITNEKKCLLLPFFIHQHMDYPHFYKKIFIPPSIISQKPHPLQIKGGGHTLSVQFATLQPG